MSPTTSTAQATVIPFVGVQGPDFYHATSAVATTVFDAAQAAGWHDRIDKLRAAGDDEGIRDHIVVKLALIGTEVSEGIEEIRNNTPLWYLGKNGKPEGVAAELADVVIRAMDLAAILGIDIDAVQQKHQYNLTRGHMHGGKKL